MKSITLLRPVRWLLLLMPGILGSCQPPGSHGPGFPYDTEHPVAVYKLPGELKEISGITWLSKNRLACIQDEAGKIYFYNLKKDELKGAVTFENNHDYEGITRVEDTLYVLQSSGNLFEVVHLGTDSQATNKIPTFLKKEDNTEGLCYDPSFNRLLIACKGFYGKKMTRHTVRIYAYDLSSGTTGRAPAYAIPLLDIQEFMQQNGIHKASAEEYKEENSGKINPFFEASDLAVDPVTNNIYILASVGKMLLVIDHSGKLLNVVTLDPDLFLQPEGITFSPEGTLYISDEGKGHKGNILEFTRTGK